MCSMPGMVENSLSERGGDGRCHGVGIRSGQRSLNADGRVLDLRQVADGQGKIAEKTESGDGRDQQRGRGSAADEEVGKAHNQVTLRGT